MSSSTATMSRPGLERILPSDCLFDPVPGQDEDEAWRGDTDEYRAWLAAAGDPAWDEFIWGEPGGSRRAIPRRPRAVRV